MNSEKTNLVVRVEGHANSYGFGEEIIPGVVLFRVGKYNLTKEQLDIAIETASKAHHQVKYQ